MPIGSDWAAAADHCSQSISNIKEKQYVVLRHSEGLIMVPSAPRMPSACL